VEDYWGCYPAATSHVWGSPQTGKFTKTIISQVFYFPITAYLSFLI